MTRSDRQKPVKILKKAQRKIKKSTPHSERIKLDQILKLLFNLSKPTLINVINGLFGENYTINDDVGVVKTSTEYVKQSLDIIRADLFLRVTTKEKSYDYHVEFQLTTDNMIIRMLEYDIHHALENQRLENNAGEVIIRLSTKSLVIHFTPSNKIPNKYKAKIEGLNGTVAEYEADVMKYYDWTDKMLIDKKLYNLLPLQLFLLKAEFERASKVNDRKAKGAAILQGKDCINKIMDTLIHLQEEQEIDGNDYNKIITGLSEIGKHLDRKYKLDNKLFGGIEVIKLLFDEKLLNRVTEAEQALRNAEQRAEQKAEQRAEQKARQVKIEMVRNMLKNKRPLQYIIEDSGFTEEQITDIQKML